MSPQQWKDLETAPDGGGPERDMSLQTRDLLFLTLGEDEHPDHYNGPCLCKLCMSYADDGGEP